MLPAITPVLHMHINCAALLMCTLHLHLRCSLNKFEHLQGHDDSHSYSARQLMSGGRMLVNHLHN